MTDKSCDGLDDPVTAHSAGIGDVLSMRDIEDGKREGGEIYKGGVAGRTCNKDEDEGDAWDNGGS